MTTEQIPWQDDVIQRSPYEGRAADEPQQVTFDNEHLAADFASGWFCECSQCLRQSAVMASPREAVCHAECEWWKRLDDGGWLCEACRGPLEEDEDDDDDNE